MSGCESRWLNNFKMATEVVQIRVNINFYFGHIDVLVSPHEFENFSMDIQCDLSF